MRRQAATRPNEAAPEEAAASAPTPEALPGASPRTAPPPAAPRTAAVAGSELRRQRRRLAARAGVYVAFVCALLALLASWGGWYTAKPLEAAVPAPEAVDPRRLSRLQRRLAGLAPAGIYVTVDTYANRLRVFRGGDLLREAICSTGSGMVLRDPVSDREWVFDTPQGERRVQRKVQDPVWVKPDWAFIEEGYEPPKDVRERMDDFSLGDYGLYLGDGYIIHGTLFQSLLGRRVTHGCIRLGDEDLEWIYWRVPMGTRVYLY